MSRYKAAFAADAKPKGDLALLTSTQSYAAQIEKRREPSANPPPAGHVFQAKNDETNPTLTANSFICHKTSESNHPDQTQIESVGVAGDHARQPVVPHARK